MALLLVLLLAATAGVPGQLPDREAELEDLRDQILGLKARLARTRREQHGLEGELSATRIALELQQKRIAEARAARQLAEEELRETEAEVTLLEEGLASLRQALRRRLADLYRLGRQGYLRPLLAISERHHLLPGIRQVRFLARRDRNLMLLYEETRTRLTVEREALVERRRGVEEWIERESQRIDQLSRLERRQRTLLARLRSESEDLLSRTEALSNKERKLANLIDFLYGRTGRPLSGTPMQSFRGALDWPAEGTVVEEFGPRLDPRYGTQVPHNGLGLTVPQGSQVRVVYPGEVLFAAPFEGYGLTVVVHHPGRVFTLYAGLVELQVAQGDMLSLGGAVGATGDHLYFEVRVENRPEDPRDWLR